MAGYIEGKLNPTSPAIFCCQKFYLISPKMEEFGMAKLPNKLCNFRCGEAEKIGYMPERTKPENADRPQHTAGRKRGLFCRRKVALASPPFPLFHKYLPFSSHSLSHICRPFSKYNEEGRARSVGRSDG